MLVLTNNVGLMILSLQSAGHYVGDIRLLLFFISRLKKKLQVRRIMNFISGDAI